MERILTYNYNSSVNKTLAEFLMNKGYGEHLMVNFRKDDNQTLINGVPSFLNTEIHSGDMITVVVRETTTGDNIIPTPMDLDIIYEDEDIILINKGINLPVHPTRHENEQTLANGLKYYYRNEKTPFIFRCITRLDKDTTGIVLLAKNPFSAALLSKQMTVSKIFKTYYAIVEGVPDPKEDIINMPIAREGEDGIKRVIDYTNGDECYTRYLVEKEANGYAFVKAIPVTGRTHQIRVHMKAIGCPIIGDKLYNPENNTMSRQALHAHSITFTHPITKAEVTYEAPMPKDMQDVYDRLFK